MNSADLWPIDIPKNIYFETEDSVAFGPSKLDMYCPEKKIMTETVVKMLKK